MSETLKFAVHNGRVAVVYGDRLVDVAGAGGPCSSPSEASEHWDELRSWASSADLSTSGVSLDGLVLDCPVARPRQSFGIGLNYRAHAEENNLAIPEEPLVFTKFPSCIVGPADELELVPGFCDFEAELVVVISRGGRNISAGDALDHVAGFTVGQDISERDRQRSGTRPQFSLGKSHRGFGPVGPFVTPLDQIAHAEDLAIGCTINGEVMQASRTSDLIFDVPTLIEDISSICELYPGDLIFTGTPSGVGVARDPQRPLAPGDIIETTIEGLGTLRTVCAGLSGS